MSLLHRSLGIALSAVTGCLAALPAVAAPPAPVVPLSSDTAAMAALNPIACQDSGPSSEDSRLAAALSPQLTGDLVGTVNAYQISCARAVVDTVRNGNWDRRAAVIAITTTIVESRMNNWDGGDRDSVGLFQQRDPWGSQENRLDPAWSTNAFLAAMKRKYPNGSWKNEEIGKVCQKVQVSAFPDRYQPQAANAEKIVSALWENAGPPHITPVYGVTDDQFLTFSTINSQDGFTGIVTSTRKLPWAPAAMTALNFNTLLLTRGSALYRVDVITNRDSLVFNDPVLVTDTGWNFDRLASDGAYVYGINAAVGHLHRAFISRQKPTEGTISVPQDLGRGYTHRAIAGISRGELLAVSTASDLHRYSYEDDNALVEHTARADFTRSWDAVLASNGRWFYGRTVSGALRQYEDPNPDNNSLADVKIGPLINTGGWTQALLAAVPGR
ncbi:tachylectin-related carbohydrate-binding protein [Actinoplanes sp. CA-252034]|uniref:tachylectin-related carbohydrate-binding protein n=1 Tax=Actinoplanes sp. CA-252034 TaxID=3239906 RepID=UPI003D979E59